MRIPTLAILAIGMVWAATPARSQTFDPKYPVCMHVVGLQTVYDDCSYFTLAQCAVSASGRPAQCNINPFYAGAKVSQGRQRHPRVY
jgi:Protein of unknown function (DUF3551)